jgi:hypothetical protein
MVKEKTRAWYKRVYTIEFSNFVDKNKDIESSVNELEAVRHYYNKSIQKTKEILGCKSLNVSNLNRSWNFTHY